MSKTTAQQEIQKALEGVKDEGTRNALALLFKAFSGEKSGAKGGKRGKVAADQGHDAGEGGNNVEGAEDGDECDVPDSDDEYAKSARGVFLGLYEAVDTISKSEDVDQGAELQSAFEKAFEDLTQLHNESAQAAFLLGSQNVQKDAKDGDPDNDDEDDEDEDDMSKRILKGASAPVVALFKALSKQNEALVAKFNQLTEEREAEKLAKRAADVGEPAAFAELLKSIADPKVRDQVANLVKGQNEVIRKSGLFNELGTTSANAAGSSALDRLNAHATEMVTKSVEGGKPLTFAMAFAKACEQHPDIYADYRKGN